MRASNHMFPLFPRARALALAGTALLAVSLTAGAAPTSLSSAPLANSAVSIKPNLMFVLDNSGSMGRDYMPDHVGTGASNCRDDNDTNTSLDVCLRGDPPYMSPHFNGQFYNPSITYLPAVKYDGSSYPSYDNGGAGRLWTAVLGDPYRSATTTDLTTQFQDAAFCISSVGSSPSAASLADPAKCRKNITVHKPTTSSITFNFESGEFYYPNNNYDLDNLRFGVRVSANLTQGGPYYYTIDPIPGAPEDPDGDIVNTVTGERQKARVMYCKTAVGAGKELTGFGDVGADINANCSLKRLSPFLFVRYGKFTRVDIKSGQSYPRVASRTDCSGAVGATGCSYQEEMTNVANWYAYYRTRMNMMKTGAGRAFVAVDEKFRVGFITIKPGNPVASDNFLKLADFTAGSGGQKDNFYDKFYDQAPAAATPLREALARVGRYYAGKGNGINSGMGSTDGSGNLTAADDPVQASCQQNFAILSTDGYWNTQDETVGPVRIDGTTRVGNQDGGTIARPQLDGLNASDTLADVAQYYYMTDLRPEKLVAGQDVWDNNVPTVAEDTANWQHMTTFTLGLGLDGVLRYRGNYGTPEDDESDFPAIVNGVLNWPVPAADSATALDDLWHAGVNGRGRFFSAKNPAQLSTGLARALESVQARVGAGAAAATSNLQPVSGDNFAFTAEYKTKAWTGDLKARTIDLTDGIISKRELWSAAALLKLRTFSDRRILTYTTNAASFPTGLKPFTFADLTAAERARFDNTRLGQFSIWTGTVAPAVGEKGTATATTLIDYVRGERKYEDTGDKKDTDLYRAREDVLGDIVNSQPIYVRLPLFGYRDRGYEEFVAAQANRRGAVYVGANDGMLHAFATDPDGVPYFQVAGITTVEQGDDTFQGTNDGGGELWAHIPNMVLPNLYRLADLAYNHSYYVDGTPIIGEACLPGCGGESDWRTILVAGLNGGGRGYYALDVTDPANPKALWEFKVRDPAVTACATTTAQAIGEKDDCDVGFSFGNPSIAKRKSDGRWVVVVTSGYNNFNPGDGNGHLYVLDAISGEILDKASLPAGLGASGGTAAASFTDANPIGLGRTALWIDEPFIDATVLRVYVGDLKGNLWRFDLSGATAVPFKVATLTDPSGNPQPITIRPELALVENQSVILIGTGKYLGSDDPADVQQQTIYAIRDAYPDNVTVTPRGGSMVQRTFGAEFVSSDGRTARPISCGPENSLFSGGSFGWFVDFPTTAVGASTGERANVDPLLLGGTLIIPSNIPSVNTCTAGGTGWVNFINHRTGCSLTTALNLRASIKIGSALVVGVNVIKLPGNKYKTIVTTADNQQHTVGTDFDSPPAQGRRASWRELLQ